MTKFGHIVVLKVAFYTSIWSVKWTHYFWFRASYCATITYFHAVPCRRAPYALGMDLFLTYAQHFDIIPHQNQASSTWKGLYPDPSMEMYVLKHSQQSDRTVIGDVVPLQKIRTLLDLVPWFGEDTNKQLTKEMSLELSLEFWLNKYLKKNFFMHWNDILMDFTFQVLHTHDTRPIVLLWLLVLILRPC